jgi:hypothetical protein
MTGYRRSKISGSVRPPANVAKVANDRSAAGQTLATLASLAGAPPEPRNWRGRLVSLIGAAIGEPSRQALALGAVPVTTGIIGDAEMGSDMIEPLLGQLAGASTNQRDVIARDVEQLCETGRAARRSAAW